MSIIKPITRHITRIPTAPEIHPRCILNMPLAANLRDYVSGQYLTLNRDGQLVYLGKDNLYHTAPADHPAIGKYGLWHDGAGQT
jgi:hypothetical protein